MADAVDPQDRSIADLSREIEDSDRESKPPDKRLRLQWNVPLGLAPHIPLWFVGLFAVVVIIVVLDALVH